MAKQTIPRSYGQAIQDNIESSPPPAGSVGTDQIADGAVTSVQRGTLAIAILPIARGDVVSMLGNATQPTLTGAAPLAADDGYFGPLFVADQDYGIGDTGVFLQALRLTGQNTAGLTPGDPVFLAASPHAGKWAAAAPHNPANYITIGFVAVVHDSLGVIALDAGAALLGGLGNYNLQAGAALDNLLAATLTPDKLAAGAAAANLGPGAVTPDMLGMTVYNGTGTTLTAGTLVYVTGWNTGAAAPSVWRADAKAVNAAATYVVIAAIATAATGAVAKRWLSAGNLNTNSASAVGAPVYSDTSNGTIGGWIVASPAYRWDVVGVVVVKSATVGQIFFDLTGTRGTTLAGNQGDIAAGTIGSAQLANGTVGNTQMAAGAALANLGGVHTGASQAGVGNVLDANAKAAIAAIQAALFANGIVTNPA